MHLCMKSFCTFNITFNSCLAASLVFRTLIALLNFQQAEGRHMLMGEQEGWRQCDAPAAIRLHLSIFLSLDAVHHFKLCKEESN